MRILALNPGSTSLRLSLIDAPDTTIAEADLDSDDVTETLPAVRRFLLDNSGADAVCIRTVHGGTRLRQTVLVDDSVRAELESAASMAPLHVPTVLRLLDAIRETLALPVVACFDTAFHSRLPAAASTYAVPATWRDQLGIRRYGFHGLSCAWSLQQAAVQLQRDARSLQLIVAHLGGGCSVTAIRDGHSVDTSMGFSPLEGLVMATRSGSVDPAAVLWLQTQHGMSAAAVSDALEHHSGLLALAGSSDMRAVAARAADGDDGARLALDVFVHRVRRGMGAVAMSLDRLDVLVFTGGIGEHAAAVRERVVAGWFESATVLVVHAREDLQMAREAADVLSRR